MEAAREALKILPRLNLAIEPSESVGITADIEVDCTGENVIGLLNEYCKGIGAPDPEYLEISAGEKEFKYSVKFKMVVKSTEAIVTKRGAEKKVALMALKKLGIEASKAESKNKLQEYCQKNIKGDLPAYEVTESATSVTFNAKLANERGFPTKKDARKALAAEAMRIINS